MQAASGLRVLEVGESRSAAFAGLILAAQGADVCQVRDGITRRLDAIESAYFDRGRWVPPPGADLAALASEADILLLDSSLPRLRELGLPATLEELRAGQAAVIVTPMGTWGPQALLVMDQINEWAAGGLAYVTRRAVPDDDVDGYSPVLPPDRQPEMLGGLAAAIGALFGMLQSKAANEPMLLDVSRQEVQAAMLHGVVPVFVWNHTVNGNPNARLSNIGMLIPASDGEVYLRTVEPHHWAGLVSWMGNPEWAQEPWASDGLQRMAHWELVRSLISEWSAQHPMRWLVEEGQRAGVPIAYTRSASEVLETEQLRSRDAWVEVEVNGSTARGPRVPLVETAPLAPARSATGWTASGGGPGIDLAGVRVLDMGWSWAGPYGGMILADLGADVIKLESGTRLDILRWSGAFADNLRDYERSGYYTSCNRGKRSATLNVKAPGSREVVLELVRHCDVLIENFAPRVMPSLGLSAAELHEANPRLVIVSMAGYGASGPERDFLSYGDHLLHASGFASLTGEDGDPNTKIGIFYGDPVGGMYAAMGALAALRNRELTGRGVHLQLSQLEGLVSLLPASMVRASLGLPNARSSQRSESMHPHGFYRCAGFDTWVSIAVSDDDQWDALRGVLQAAGIAVPRACCLQERLACRDEIDAALANYTATRSPWDVTTVLQEAGIAAYPVQSAPRLLWDDHLAAREFFPIIRRPIVGPGPITGPVFRSATGAVRPRGYAPLLGEHNREVYREILGFSEEAFHDALESGLIS